MVSVTEANTRDAVRHKFVIYTRKLQLSTAIIDRLHGTQA